MSEVLRPGLVMLWKVVISDHLAHLSKYTAILDEHEMGRARRFVSAADRNEYTISHGIQRLLLSRYTDIAPKAIIYTKGQQGKPYLKGSHIHFNMSHSNGVVLYAFSADSAVGVDVESLSRKVDVEALSERFFAPQEYAQLMKLDENQRHAAFVRCWVMKEAYIKRTGKGLSQSLNQFVIDIIPDSQQVDADHWLQVVNIGMNHLAAFATQSPVDYQLKAFIL